MFSSYSRIVTLGGPILPQIRHIVMDIVYRSWCSRDFITCLGEFIFYKRREGRDFPRDIRRLTVKLEYLLRQLLHRGIRDGEIRDISIASTATNIIDLIQAYIFRLAILRTAKPQGNSGCAGRFSERIIAQALGVGVIPAFFEFCDFFVSLRKKSV